MGLEPYKCVYRSPRKCNFKAIGDVVVERFMCRGLDGDRNRQPIAVNCDQMINQGHIPTATNRNSRDENNRGGPSTIA
jgi:hypothetical protein